MRDIPLTVPETLKDFHNLAARFSTNPGGLRMALVALVARGWNPNEPLEQCFLPLYDALLRRNAALTCSLLDVGACPMRCQPPGTTSILAQAVIWNEASVVREMLKSPAADPIAKTNGETLLHFAAKNGSIEMMEILVAAGVDPWEPSDEGDTAYDTLAREQGQHATQWGVYLDFANQLKRLKAEGLVHRLNKRLADPESEPVIKSRHRM